MLGQLAEKYNVPTPRYTSYPTVPAWDQGIDPDRWLDNFARQFQGENMRHGISLYIHLPFANPSVSIADVRKRSPVITP